MSPLEQLRHVLARAWEPAAAGWRELVSRAGDTPMCLQPVYVGDQYRVMQRAWERSGRAASLPVGAGNDRAEANHAPGFLRVCNPGRDTAVRDRPAQLTRA